MYHMYTQYLYTQITCTCVHMSFMSMSMCVPGNVDLELDSQECQKLSVWVHHTFQKIYGDFGCKSDASISSSRPRFSFFAFSLFFFFFAFLFLLSCARFIHNSRAATANINTIHHFLNSQSPPFPFFLLAFSL